MNNITWVSLALVLLLAAIIAPLGLLAIFYHPVVQMVVAVVVLAVLLMLDPYAGLVLGIALLVLYFRLYRDPEAQGWDSTTGEPRTQGPMARLVSQYVTPKHLEDAQNNIVNKADYEKEMIGIQGVYGEPVYSAQGIDKMMPGWEVPSQLTGSPVDFASVPTSTIF